MKKKKDDDNPTSWEERQKLYQKYQDRLAKDKKAIPASTEQFLEACKRQAKWDNTHAITFEKLIKRPFNLGDFKEWYDKAFPLWKKLQAVFGNRVCKAYGCMEIIPKTANPRQEYCSGERCRQRERNRKRDKKKKAASNLKSYGKKYIEKEGITEKEFDRAVKVLRDYKKERGCS